MVRPFPFPYRAMVAICSDLDLTPTADVYLESMRYLNTTGETLYGTGVGLEIGNSIYFDMPAGHVSYWNVDDGTQARIRTLIKSRHIDCLHSFGDLATTRARAATALEELDRHGCRMRVWVDHAVAPSNFGSDRMAGAGDVVGSPVFHADLTCAFGIEYVWLGRVTSVTGQNAQRSLRGLLDRRRLVPSGITIAKEVTKGALGRAGHRKYAMHGDNRLMRSVKLRSGHPVREFLRANPHSGGVSCGDTADGLGDVLTGDFLDRVTSRGAVTILYTHLGKFADRARPFRPQTQEGLQRLAVRQSNGDVLVATTERVLDYCRMTEEVSVTERVENETTWIDVAHDRVPVDGLTIYTDRPHSTRVRVKGRECARLQRNPSDHTGRASVSIPWTRLEFPAL